MDKRSCNKDSCTKVTSAEEKRWGNAEAGEFFRNQRKTTRYNDLLASSVSKIKGPAQVPNDD